MFPLVRGIADGLSSIEQKAAPCQVQRPSQRMVSYRKICFGCYKIWNIGIQGCLHRSGPLVQLLSFQVEMIRWDGVHILNLGGDLWVCAWLCHQEAPATQCVEGLEMKMTNEGDPLLMAYVEYKAWCRANKAQ